MTIRGMMGAMAEAGLRFSGETLYKYLHFLEEAFMVFTVSFHSKSEKIRNRNYRKMYAVDWSLADAVCCGEGISASRKLENLVYLELRRRGNDISYYRTGQDHEIDFIAVSRRKGKQHREIYQVCYSMDTAEIRNREIRGIAQTCRELNIDSAYVITFNDEETLEADGIPVTVVPAWKWLLR